MYSYTSVPLNSRKIYVPIEYAKFFEDHPKADWDTNKNDVHCPDHNVTFGAVTKLAPMMTDRDSIVFYEGILHPRTQPLQQLAELELNRNY